MHIALKNYDGELNYETSHHVRLGDGRRSIGTELPTGIIKTPINSGRSESNKYTRIVMSNLDMA